MNENSKASEPLSTRKTLSAQNFRKNEQNWTFEDKIWTPILIPGSKKSNFYSKMKILTRKSYFPSNMKILTPKSYFLSYMKILTRKSNFWLENRISDSKIDIFIHKSKFWVENRNYYSKIGSKIRESFWTSKNDSIQ